MCVARHCRARVLHDRGASRASRRLGRSGVSPRRSLLRRSSYFPCFCRDRSYAMGGAIFRAVVHHDGAGTDSRHLSVGGVQPGSVEGRETWLHYRCLPRRCDWGRLLELSVPGPRTVFTRIWLERTSALARRGVHVWPRRCSNWSASDGIADEALLHEAATQGAASTGRTGRQPAAARTCLRRSAWR